MGIDPILDMGRTATDVFGNSIASAVVARCEGELAPAGTKEEDDTSRSRNGSAPPVPEYGNAHSA